MLARPAVQSAFEFADVVGIHRTGLASITLHLRVRQVGETVLGQPESTARGRESAVLLGRHDLPLCDVA